MTPTTVVTNLVADADQWRLRSDQAGGLDNSWTAPSRRPEFQAKREKVPAKSAPKGRRPRRKNAVPGGRVRGEPQHGLHRLDSGRHDAHASARYPARSSPWRGIFGGIALCGDWELRGQGVLGGGRFGSTLSERGVTFARTIPEADVGRLRLSTASFEVMGRGSVRRGADGFTDRAGGVRWTWRPPSGRKTEGSRWVGGAPVSTGLRQGRVPLVSAN